MKVGTVLKLSEKITYLYNQWYGNGFANLLHL